MICFWLPISSIIGWATHTRDPAIAYIDIILVGDEATAHNLTFVKVPALEECTMDFTTLGTRFGTIFEGGTLHSPAPVPTDMKPVIIALDDPMRVDHAIP